MSMGVRVPTQDENLRLLKENDRMRGCLMAIANSTHDTPGDVLATIAYDTVFNGITRDVAEYQIKKRTEDEEARKRPQRLMTVSESR